MFRKIRQANPQRLSNKPCVYIGQSYFPPEIRFEQHKEGYRSNKYAKEYGIALKPELYDKYNPIPTRKDAVEIEAWLAKELRKKGIQFGMDNTTLVITTGRALRFFALTGSICPSSGLSSTL